MYVFEAGGCSAPKRGSAFSNESAGARGRHLKRRSIKCRPGRKRQSACKPGSVWRGYPRVATIHLGRPLPDASRNQPGRLARKAAGISPASSLFGFAPGGVYHAGPVAGPAVGSYPTFSPLPMAHHRRFDLCGTFPEVALAGRYPAPSLHGARTFLPRAEHESGRPAD